MKQIPDTLTLLRKHAKGELNDEEHRAFEALLLERPELYEEVELTKSLIQATEKVERQRLLALIRSVETQPDAPGLFQVFKRRVLEELERLGELLFPPAHHRKLAWATVVVLLFAAVGLWWMSRQSDALRAFQSREAALVSPAVPESLRRATGSSALSIALREYEIGNYRESLDALKGISNADSLYLMSLFVQGYNYFRLGDYANATNFFAELDSLSGETTRYKLPDSDNVAWARMLAILSQYNLSKEESKKRELEQALQGFLSTANPDDAYFIKATELQDLLQREN